MSKLDANQIIKLEHDDASSSKKVTIQNAEISMELNASDGDSVLVVNNSVSASATALDNTDTGIIVAEFPVDGAGVINMYVRTDTLLAGPQVITLEISPVAAGDVWMDSTVTVTPSTSAGVMLRGTAETDLVAKRARVKIAAAITSGTFSVYVEGRSS